MLEWAHPIVRDWFVDKFGRPTEAQGQGWPHIVAGRSVLISAPTGSGKTLAAFLACIDGLVGQAAHGTIPGSIQVVYVSPLRALSNDIQKNLQAPLREIQQRAKLQGLHLSEITTAVRTGDTLNRERQAMLRHPPHILVTTPESLYILLTAEKSRALMKQVHTVIVDEIHAMADDKRGAHLALTLERLEALTVNRLLRIGLSATQNPIEEIAKFLCGAARPLPEIVNAGHRRDMDLAIEVPGMELGAVASNELWDEVEERIARLVSQHRSTLVFVNTRKLAERTSHRLAKKLPPDTVAAHHGSLSRKLRLAVETQLKQGELKALVATASLELGIDIGSVDLVCQIGSTRSIADALQRVGRSGHWHGATPKGRFFPTTRDELVECAALVHAIRSGDLDRLMIPDAPLDVLAQQIIAMCSAEEWKEDDLFNVIQRAYPYRNLTADQFADVVSMLSDGMAATRARYGAYLHRDGVNKIVRARRGSRLIAITSGGAIPETGNFTVVAEPEGTVIGTLDEDFAVESNQGDVMLLGNTSWMIRRVESRSARVLVQDAHGAPPTVPFWRGEAPGRTPELSAHVAGIRVRVADAPATAAIDQLMQTCALDRSGAEQIAEYITQGKAILGAVPTQKTVIAERFFDESGGMQLIIHAPFGARINKAWGLALRKRFCRSFNLELQASATDDGINIALTEQHSFPLGDVFHFLHPNTVESVLTQAAFASPLFGTRWRWDAMRSLAVPRFQRGKKVPLQILRMRAEDLLASVFPDAAACQDNIAGEIQPPDHPLVNETMNDVLREAMDVDGLKQVLRDIYSGAIECRAVDTVAPSPFCHEILNANPYAYLDDAPLEERRARAVSLRRVLPSTVLQEVGMLDATAIQQVIEQSWPDVRTADELHDALLTLVALPSCMARAWEPFMEQLLHDHRAGIAEVGGFELWYAAERMRCLSAAYPSLRIRRSAANVDTSVISYEEAVLRILRGWMQIAGPVTSAEIGNRLKLSAGAIDQAMLRLESAGSVLRGEFTRSHAGAIEWCDRRLLARIHRMTLGSLRKQIEPATAAQFVRWLFRWMHVAPGTQLRGEQGTIEILRQLQGFEIPAREWERNVLSRRIADYNPVLLDKLCWTGIVGWGRFSAPSDTAIARRMNPGKAAPITFFLREDPPAFLRSTALSHAADLGQEATKVWDALGRRGASFLPELARCTSLSQRDVELSLWRLVGAGLVTADGFESLRRLLHSGQRSRASARSGAGRWSQLTRDDVDQPQATTESICRTLLNRYGIVFRDVLLRESLIPSWRDLLLVFRRMEDRGEVRGGRFVSGFVGEQFALPLAVDSLRAIRKTEPSGELVSISAADPLNLVGIIVPGQRLSSASRTSVTFRDGVPVESDYCRL